MRDAQEPGQSTSENVPIERALLVTARWLAGALAASALLLVVDVSGDPLPIFIAQLTGLVVFALILSYVLVPLGTSDWFAGSSWSPLTVYWASGVGLVVLVTGTVGLVTLASSAALRFDPSTQFLQLLSALDIAWVVAALAVGVFRWSDRLDVAVASSAIIGVICVWAIWNYLVTVGFGPNGEWIVSSADLARLVLPFDVASAFIAVAFFAVGSRKAAQATEHPSPQS